jgi:hypothetical protein
MRLGSYLPRAALSLAGLGMCLLVSVSAAQAEDAADADARKVLGAMSSYLGGLKSFSASYSAVDEVVTKEGQKLQFLHSGEIAIQRPNKLHAIRTGAAGTAEIFFDGKSLELYRRDANVYLQFDAANIDQAIDVIHNFGFDAPGADLLTSKPLDPSTTDLVSGTHVGMTFVNGTKVHQMAFRGTDVDWQLWVMEGDKPLPVRYVVTTKNSPGAPEFTLQLSDWNTSLQIDAARFTFVPPQGATKLDPTAVEINAIGDLTIKGK